MSQMTLSEIVAFLETGYDEETGEIIDRPEIEALLADKIEGCHTVVKRWKAIAAGAKLESARLSERARMFNARADGLSNYVLACLKQAGETKVVTDTVTASIRKGSQSVAVVDESLIPNEFIRTTPTVDKKAVSAVLKAGGVVPGCEQRRGPESLSWR